MNKISEYLKTVRWIIGFIFILGVALTLLADKIVVFSVFWSGLISHLGTALIISSVIGLFLELSEIKDFFEKIIAGILCGDEYVWYMSEDRLIEMNITSIKGIGKQRITNPNYDYYNFASTIGYEIIYNIGQVYRKAFFETIDRRLLTEDEIKVLGADPDMLKKENIMCLDITTRFELISPSQNEYQEFKLEYAIEPNLIPELEYSTELWVNDKKVDLKDGENIKKNDKCSSFDVEYSVNFKDTASIKYKRVSYHSELLGSINHCMNTLTHGVTIHFSSRDELELRAEIYGITTYKEPSITTNSISIQNIDWALPVNGYFISWQKKMANGK